MSPSKNARKVDKVNLETRLIELSQRIPLIVNDAIDEKKVQKHLGLSSNKPFLVIARLRFIDGKPRVIYRTYLNPEQFPDDFLIKHDFQKESLIDIYSNYGYKIIYRNISITARFPTDEEKKLLQIEGQKLVPVLSTYQHLISVEKDAGSEFVLEVLYATYLDWKFNVERHTETFADK